MLSLQRIVILHKAIEVVVRVKGKGDNSSKEDEDRKEKHQDIASIIYGFSISSNPYKGIFKRRRS